MPRRRQGHLHLIQKSRRAEVVSGGCIERNVRPKHGIARNDGRKIRRQEAEDNDQTSSLSLYSHKKFKKMESNEVHSGGPAATAANLSLEALFQVTGHELQKIKLSSSRDSDGSEQCPSGATRGDDVEEDDDDDDNDDEEENGEKRSRKKRKSPGRKPSEEEEDDPEASKRLRLRRHACPYCGLGCGKPSVLQKHIRAHTNERPYPCVPCGFSFKTKSNLYKHRKSRAHHLKVSGRTENERTDESSNSCKGDGDEDLEDSEDLDEASDNNNKDDARKPVPASSPSVRSETCSVIAGEEKRSGSATPGSIYKPKFHSVSYNVPSPKTDGGRPEEVTSSCSDSANSGRINGVSGNATSLAKRRNDQFQLRLEIPRPLAPPPPSLHGVFPSSSSSSSSSSSTRSISSRCSASSPSRPEAATTNGDRLPVSLSLVVGHPSGEALPRTLESPKLASPEYLQQHISKLISQNAAIVETFDPLWPRRYTRQHSVPSARSAETEGGGSKEQRCRRYSEDVAPPPAAFSSKSKLALALLSDSSTIEAAPPRRPSPGATLRNVHPRGVFAEELLRSKEAPPPLPLPRDDPEDSPEEVDGGSIVRSLLLVNRAKSRSGNLSKMEERGSSIEVPHPQNPEGSIIKDLLLKTRTGGGHSHSRHVPSLQATCMRLSGGSVSSSDASSSLDNIRVASSPPPPQPLLPSGQSGIAVYTCSSCNIAYRKAENLEAHRSRYCPNKALVTATSGGSFSFPLGVDSSSPGVIEEAPFHLKNAGREVTGSAGEHLGQKPRGRPRGSKNRPKLDAVPPGVGAIPKMPPPARTHSKSVSESGGEMLRTRDETIDALKGKLRYRRNSVSGDGATLDSPDPYPTDGEAKKTEHESFDSCWRNEKSTEEGPILKKHLLGGDKSPPSKKRKASVVRSVDVEPELIAKSNVLGSTILSLKSLEHLSKYPMRASAVHLFGGEVQICDGAETKKMIIDNKMAGSSSGHFLGGIRGGSDSTTSSVVATIAMPVHNSGGTVLRVRDSKASLLHEPVCVPAVSIGRPLMATGSEHARSPLPGSIILRSPKPALASRQFSIDISHLKLLNPNPILDMASSALLPSPSLPIPSSHPPPPPLLLPSSNMAFSDGASVRNDSESSPTRVLPDEEAAARAHDVPLIAIHSPRSPSAPSDDPVSPSPPETHLSPARPTTLALRSANAPSVGMTLVSPETPRPKRKSSECYTDGAYYTHLVFKQSTRVYYCNYNKPIPMFVPQSVDPKLSMYSVWQTCPPQNPEIDSLTPPQGIALYRSKPPNNVAYTIAKPAKTPLVLTHSSYWTFQQKGKDDVPTPPPAEAQPLQEIATVSGDDRREVDEAEMESDVSRQLSRESAAEDANEGSDEEMDERSAVDTPETSCTAVDEALFKSEIPLKHRLKDALEVGIHEPRRVKIFEGGFKSNEDYTYVRGRGRGKYVCEECGIRCKKPSMLKKHIRTHTDVRPYTCKHCNFSFKTKGNLTKHMKSKAHHKKCVELGIVPVPVTIDDAQIDEEALARQERIEHQRKQFADVDEDSNLDEDEDDEEDDDYYDQVHEEYKEGEDEDDESMELEGQFEDANEAPLNKSLPVESVARKGCPEQEIARSLLELAKPEIAVGVTSQLSPTHFDIRAVKDAVFHPRPTMSAVSHHLKRDDASDEREELIGNPRVAWAPCPRDVESCRLVSDIVPHPKVYEPSYDALSERTEEISVGSNSRERVVSMNPPGENRIVIDRPSFVSRSDGFTAAEGSIDDRAHAPHSTVPGRIEVNSTSDDCDQPIDLSMPHSRCDQPEWDEEEQEEEEEEGVAEEDEDDEEGLEDDEDEGEIVVDDEDDAGEKVGPFYHSFPEFDERRSGRSAIHKNISPVGSPEHREKVSVLPTRLHSPRCEDSSEGGRVVNNAWSEKRVNSPQCSVLHSYLSDQSPPKRVSIEVVATVSHHRSFGEKDSSLVAMPTSRAPSFSYSSSPPSRMDSILEPTSRKLPHDRMSRLPSASIHNMPQYIHRSMDDDKCICTICNKAFNKPSQLRLHVNIHYFERPFRCDSCAISFRTKGHLQKHKRSVSHYNKVNMNMTFGTPTTDNPRPFKCDDCKIAFRIHGHLAKHLRSKMHIMKLECLGKLPFGTYAEIERSGANLNEIDTTDCENSLESLQVMAHRLVDKVAVPQHWPRERTISGGSCDDQSDGVPYVESPLPVPVLGGGGVTNCATNAPRQFVVNRASSEEGCVSPDAMDSEHLVTRRRTSLDGDLPALPAESSDVGAATAALPSTIKCEPNEVPHLMNLRAKTVLATVVRRREDEQPASSQRTRSTGSLIQEYEDISDEEISEMESSERNSACFACRVCGKSLKSAKFLQLHMYVDHADHPMNATDDRVDSDGTSSSSSILHSSLKRRKTRSSPLLSISLATSTTIAGEGFVCQLCGESFGSGHHLKQHMLIHAQFRPFVCSICDAGFTHAHFLELHTLQSHPQGKSFACRECNLVFGLSEDLKQHVNRTHPIDRVR